MLDALDCGMHVSKEADYGLRVMVVVALGQISIKDIAERYRIPHNFVALIIPKLVRAGLIAWAPKTKGMYQLAKPADQIACLDVILALEGSLDFLGKHSLSEIEKEPLFHPMLKAWRDLQEHAQRYLAGITIAQLAGD